MVYIFSLLDALLVFECSTLELFKLYLENSRWLLKHALPHDLVGLIKGIISLIEFVKLVGGKNHGQGTIGDDSNLFSFKFQEIVGIIIFGRN